MRHGRRGYPERKYASVIEDAIVAPQQSVGQGMAPKG